MTPEPITYRPLKGNKQSACYYYGDYLGNFNDPLQGSAKKLLDRGFPDFMEIYLVLEGTDEAVSEPVSLAEAVGDTQ